MEMEDIASDTQKYDTDLDLPFKSYEEYSRGLQESDVLKIYSREEVFSPTPQTQIESQTPFPFLNLPLEIRRLVYHEIFAGIQGDTLQNLALLGPSREGGTRVIHISDRPQSSIMGRGESGILYHYLCFMERSETDIYESFATPEVFRTRPRHPAMAYTARHDWCDRYIWHSNPRRMKRASLDLSFRKVSSEFRREGLRIFFSFAYPEIPAKWIATVSEDLRPFVRNIRLEMELDGKISDSHSKAAVWANTVSDLATLFPHIGTLHLVLHLKGYATCWSHSQHSAVTGMFRQLRHLCLMKEFTVIITEGGEKTCNDRAHTAFHHPIIPGALRALEGRKLRRSWAEEIRELVLRREVPKDGVS